MSKKIAIVQSNYIPWKGYFDIIKSVDEFIVFDDAQYTKGDWRNRNLIKTPQGVQWITVPVRVKLGQKIREVKLDGQRWPEFHLRTLEMNYKKANHYEEVSALINPIYQKKHSNLSELNIDLLKNICNYLNIKTRFSHSWDYNLGEGKTDRLVSLCQQAEASEYVSGPAAESYIEKTQFENAGIKLSYFSYAGYQEYPQLWGEFSHQVTVLDLLFNCGKSSINYLKAPQT